MMTHFFYILFIFIVGLFFLIIGFLSILIQTSVSIRSDFVSFILEDSFFLSLFGITCLLIGAAIVFYLMTSFKKRYVKIKSQKNNAYYLDESLFEDYMKNYWKQLFPKNDIPNHVTIKKNKVLITADLPYVPETQQKALLSRIDNDLKDLFSRLLGYHQKYIISISFENEPSTEKTEPLNPLINSHAKEL
jgi:hypothetical protein